MKKIKICGWLAVVGACACSLNAETLIWYHLDEKAIGARHANNGTIVNAAATGTKYNGTTTAYNGSTRSGESWLQPLGVASLPAGYQYYDPVSKTSYAPGTAVWLKANKNNQSGWAGAIEVPYDAELDETGDFTMELFFKYMNIEDGVQPSVEQTLVCRQISESNGGSAIELTLTGNARAMFRYAYEDGDGNVKATNKIIEGFYYNDYRWHHLALTYTKSSKTLRFYVDRALQCTLTLDYDLYPTKMPFIMGVNPKRGWGGACECVDEFRYSNVALLPNQFIRAVNVSGELPVMPETVIYNRFGQDGETVCGGYGQNDGIFRNQADGENAYGAPNIIKYNGSAPTTGEVCAASTFMTNAFSGAKFSNNRVARLRTTSASKSTVNRVYSWGWENVPAKLSDSDFTCELIFRIPTADSLQHYIMCERSSWQWSISSGGTPMFRWDAISTVRVDDGRWHQLAIVHEKASKTIKCYVDYVLAKTYSGEGSKGDLPSTGNGDLSFGGYETSYYNETFSDIDLDEFRVTRKALALGEMLHPGDGKVLWDLDVANQYGWNSRIFAFSAPNVSCASHSYSNEVPYATTHAGIEGATSTNEASFFFNKAKSSGGILLPDPENTVSRTNFTAELVFKVDLDAAAEFAQDCAYLFCQRGVFFVRYNQNGNIRFCDASFKDVVELPKSQVNDGKWHHLAFVQDRDHGELRAYFDYKEVGRMFKTQPIDTSDEGKTLYVNCGCWGNTSEYSTGPMLLNRMRITSQALRPTEFVTSQALDGNLLHWAGFENDGSVVPDYGFGVSATIAKFGTGAGKLTNASGEEIRANHHSAWATGAKFSLNSLLERPDQSVEFFLKATAADDETDLVAFCGASESDPIWALRKTSEGMKVVVKTAGGSATVASAGDLPRDWTHFAITFEPGDAKTTVKVYRDHSLLATGEFDGTLQVANLPTSALKVGSFDGRVDELRVFKGTLTAADMLYATPLGMFLIIK